MVFGIKNFEHKKNTFCSENKFNIWDEQIKNIKLEQSEYDSLTKNSIEHRMEYNLENFHNSFLKEILDKNYGVNYESISSIYLRLFSKNMERIWNPQ